MNDSKFVYERKMGGNASFGHMTSKQADKLRASKRGTSGFRQQWGTGSKFYGSGNG